MVTALGSCVKWPLGLIYITHLSEIINLLVGEDQLTKVGFMVAMLGSVHTI